MFNTMPQRKRPYFLGVWLSHDEHEQLQRLSSEKRVSDVIRKLIIRASPETPHDRQPDHRG